MRKILFILLAACVMIGASAQDNSDKKLEERIEKITKKLKLTAEQQAQFVPVYTEYHKELQAHMGELRKNGNPGQDRQARIEAMKEAAKQVRDKYNTQFSVVLSPEQLDKLYKMEEEMREQMRNRNGHMGQGRPGNGHGRPGGNGQRHGFDGSFHNNGGMTIDNGF